MALEPAYTAMRLRLVAQPPRGLPVLANAHLTPQPMIQLLCSDHCLEWKGDQCLSKRLIQYAECYKYVVLTTTVPHFSTRFHQDPPSEFKGRLCLTQNHNIFLNSALSPSGTLQDAHSRCCCCGGSCRCGLGRPSKQHNHCDTYASVRGCMRYHQRKSPSRPRSNAFPGLCRLCMLEGCTSRC